MCIKRYLLVGYIVSFLVLVSWLYRDKVINFIELYIFNNNDVLLELYIPRIKLDRNVYNIDSILNDVDYNVEILSDSRINSNLYFLAAHSGGGKASYFDNLVYLEKGDLIFISSSVNRLVFVVEKVFYIKKNGNFFVSYNSKGEMLFLITCSLEYIDRQLVVQAKLVYEC